MRKIRVIYLIILGFLMIFGGIILQVVSFKENDIIKRNQNKIINERKCLDEICVENLQIIEKDKKKFISLDIFSQKEYAIPEGYFQIVFDNNNQLSYTIYHGQILPNIQQNIEFQVEQNKILNVKDYKLILLPNNIIESEAL